MIYKQKQNFGFRVKYAGLLLINSDIMDLGLPYGTCAVSRKGLFRPFDRRQGAAILKKFDWNITGTTHLSACIYEGWNFNSGNYLFTTDTK